MIDEIDDARADDESDLSTESNDEAVELELRPELADRNLRLDKYLASQIEELSRSTIQQIIEQGQVMVDGVARRQTFKMTPGQVIHVILPEVEHHELAAEAIPLSIVYEDKDVLVIDKEAGMVVHPAPGHASGTLVNAVLAHAPEIAIAGSNRPGIVHRLDKDTSGLIVIAKTDRARTTLVKQWNQRTVVKRYIALVRGVVEDRSATIAVPIGRDPVQRNRMAVLPNGRKALTRFTVSERFTGATLLDLEIETGRTHQIRVHLAYIGHPVIADIVYNRSHGEFGGVGAIAPRQFLHAAELGFNLPGGRPVHFVSPLPSDLATTLSHLRDREPQ